jgi:5,6-dimethylbenzimidazole synthase
MIPWILLSFFLSLLAFFGTQRKRPSMSLEDAFHRYVQSVQNSDLEGLFELVTNQEPFHFITAEGQLIDSREGYYQFHKEWFREMDWEMPVELLHVYQREGFGFTIAIFHFRTKTEGGGWDVLDSYFLLFFEKQEGEWKVIADVCTPISRHTVSPDQDLKYTLQQSYLFDLFKSRRTVRKFESSPVPRDHLWKILDAARSAPTAGNQQPWTFLVVQDREKLRLLQEETLDWVVDSYRENRDPNYNDLRAFREQMEYVFSDIFSAPLYVAVLVNSQEKYPEYVLYDGTLAAGHLMIAARSLGYGTGFYTTYFPEERIKDFFNIPNQYQLVCFTPIGIPETWPEPPEKKDLEELVVFDSF